MGTLYLLSLPIGNLDDLTLRGKKALETGQFFAVEDTRSFFNFLHLLGIKAEGKNIFSFHDQSDEKAVDKSIQILKEGNDLYMASEAGSPIISDPAYPLIKKAISEKIDVVTIPGVTSVVAALEISGLPPYPFTFMGFFPRDKSLQKETINKVQNKTETFIFFESPHRILSTLENLTQNFPEASFSVVREITKKFESVYRFQGAEFDKIKESITVKGEFVFLFSQKSSDGDIGTKKVSNEELISLSNLILEKGPSTKSLSKLLSLILDKNSKDIYNLLSKKSVTPRPEKS